MNVTMMSRTAVMAALLGLPPVLAAQQPADPPAARSRTRSPR